MNKYFDAVLCKKETYNSDGTVSTSFSLDVLLANGIAFATGFAIGWFTAPVIPGVKNLVK